MLSTQELEKCREERGLEIVNKNSQIERINDWVCECPDHKFRGSKCKHIWALEFSLKLREQVKKDTVIQQITISECIFCHSQNTRKFGVRRNKSGDIQRFICESCGKTFSINIDFERLYMSVRIDFKSRHSLN
jgi:transcription elongation factor Elf1